MDQIGPKGRLIGVDLSSEMLACAQERVHREGWKNVELIEADIAAYEFPEGLNGVISTGVFGYVSEREHVIEKISHALVPGGRLAINVANLGRKPYVPMTVFFHQVFLGLGFLPFLPTH